MKDRPCGNCGIPFKPKRKRDKYCCGQCGIDAKTGQRQLTAAVWSFKCGHTAVLPGRIGLSNSEAIWKASQVASVGGYWICRRCTTAGQEQYRHGTGPAGKITKIRKILRQARVNAELRGYVAIVLSALQVLAIWEKQKGRCAACRDSIAFAGRAAAQLDHDHVTGRVRGFLCRTCNIAEGFLKDYSPAKFRRFCAYRRRCHQK